MKRLFLLLVVLLAVNPLQARLGETEAEVVARYGKAISVAKGHDARESRQLFTHDGYKITVKFLDGKSGYEEYTREDLRNIEFSADEIKTLLTVNCMGLQWNRVPATERDPMWEKNWEIGTAGKTVAVASIEYPYTVLAVATAQFVHYNSEFEKPPNEHPEPAGQ